MTLDEILETFEALDEGEDRYRFLMDLGREIPGIPEHERTEASRVHGCQSRVWMLGEAVDGRLRLRADSDAFIVRGLIAILLALYDGAPLEVARALDPKGTFEQIGLEA
ncbi:MAG TPA: SufE family protein, partial [Myxococcota bacterium]|nr:SufE family protein [Myxococcota bacterium]